MCKHHRFFKVAAFVLSATVLNGCANFTKTISPADKHLPTDAYIYGKFEMDSVKAGYTGYQTMGFSIICDNNKEYLIKFSMEEPLQVIKVKPAICSFEEIIYTNAEGAIRKRKPAPEKIMKEMPVKPDTAYYFGDYSATSSTSYSGTYIHMNWRINSIKNKFTETTKELKEEFPNLGSVATENIMLYKSKI